MVKAVPAFRKTCRMAMFISTETFKINCSRIGFISLN